MPKLDIPATPDQRRDAAAQRLADYIATVLATAPPLTEEQRSCIAALLRNGGGSNAAA
jgi:hypothetical protein